MMMLYMLYFYVLISYSYSKCHFNLSSIQHINGPFPAAVTHYARNLVGGRNMALKQFHEGKLYEMKYMTSNIYSLNDGNGSMCTMSIEYRDPLYNLQKLVSEVFELTQLFQDNYNDKCDVTNNTNSTDLTDLNVPFILGPDSSSYTITINPVMETFKMIQISSGATSTILSDYPSFFRVIPTDGVQAKALILLCKHFGWNKIGILFIDNYYGSSFQRELISFGDQYNISTQSFGYMQDNITFINTIESMKKSDLFIFILILLRSDEAMWIQQLKKNNMHKYPYYFLGNDAIFAGGQAHYMEILDVFGGIVGTCPWSTSIDDPFATSYPYPVNESQSMYQRYRETWINMADSSIDMFMNLLHNISEPSLYSVYGYDSALTVIKAIDKFIEIFNITEFDEFVSLKNNDINTFSDNFKKILSDIWFIGLSGNVSFYDTGDRKGGLYSFCNIHPINGTLKVIGFMIDDISQHDIIMNIDDINWPLPFIQHDTIPKTEYTEIRGIASLNNSFPVFIWILTFLSIFIMFIYMFLLYFYRQRKIIMASQWRLNLVMLCGCIIGYVAIIMYGIDESFPDNNNQSNINWLYLCNMRIIILNISFSFIFGPMLAKMYRMKKIFNFKCKEVSLSAPKMILFNSIYVIFELIIVIILIIILPNNRVYTQSIIDTNTHFIEYFGSCTSG
eukprot:229686_1